MHLQPLVGSTPEAWPTRDTSNEVEVALNGWKATPGPPRGEGGGGGGGGCCEQKGGGEADTDTRGG